MTTAVVLAAGRGTRMGALTAATPKPLLPVAGRPMIEHVLRGFAGAGVRRAVIVTGYLGEQIEAALGDGAQLGLELAYCRQERADGTARALLLAESLLGREPFVVSWGDILVPPAFYRRVRRPPSRARPCDAQLAVNEVGRSVARRGGVRRRRMARAADRGEAAARHLADALEQRRHLDARRRWRSTTRAASRRRRAASTSCRRRSRRWCATAARCAPCRCAGRGPTSARRTISPRRRRCSRRGAGRCAVSAARCRPSERVDALVRALHAPTSAAGRR